MLWEFGASGCSHSFEVLKKYLCSSPLLFVGLLCARSSCGHFSVSTLRGCSAFACLPAFLEKICPLHISCDHCQAYYAQGRAGSTFTLLGLCLACFNSSACSTFIFPVLTSPPKCPHLISLPGLMIHRPMLQKNRTLPTLTAVSTSQKAMNDKKSAHLHQQILPCQFQNI